MSWTVERDAILLAGKAAKLDFPAIGERLGVSKSAAIARYHRLIGTVFPSDAPDKRQAREMIRKAKRNLRRAGAQ